MVQLPAAARVLALEPDLSLIATRLHSSSNIGFGVADRNEREGTTVRFEKTLEWLLVQCGPRCDASSRERKPR